MAILEDLGLEVSIIVNGTAVPEHDDPSDKQEAGEASTRVCSKYAEIVDGAEFSIGYRVTEKDTWIRKGKDHCLEFHMKVDGHTVRRSILYLADHCLRLHLVQGITRKTTHGWELSKFRFQTVITEDEANLEKIKQDSVFAKNLGLIQVTVRKYNYLGSKPDKHGENFPRHQLTVAEKALKGKAISHGTSYSAPVRTKPYGTCRIEDLDLPPVAIFNIKYRSRAALQAELIIPRDDSPPSSPGPQELTRQIKEEESKDIKPSLGRGEKTSLKRQLGDVIDLTGLSERPRKTFKKEKPVMIDLTSDD